MKTVSAYEDNAGGLYLTDGEIIADVTAAANGAGEEDMQTFSEWRYDASPQEPYDPDFFTHRVEVARLDDDGFEVFLDRAGGSALAYFGIDE